MASHPATDRAVLCPVSSHLSCGVRLWQFWTGTHWGKLIAPGHECHSRAGRLISGQFLLPHSPDESGCFSRSISLCPENRAVFYPLLLIWSLIFLLLPSPEVRVAWIVRRSRSAAVDVSMGLFQVCIWRTGSWRSSLFFTELNTMLLWTIHALSCNKLELLD